MVTERDLEHLVYGMSVDYNLYFDCNSETFFVPTLLLTTTRSREDGILNAIRRMKEAAAGERARRQPITVEQKIEKFSVLDGNSTTIVAKKIGIEILPCRFQRSI